MKEKKTEKIAFRITPTLKQEFSEAGDYLTDGPGVLFTKLAEAIVEDVKNDQQIYWPPKLVKQNQFNPTNRARDKFDWIAEVLRCSDDDFVDKIFKHIKETSPLSPQPTTSETSNDTKEIDIAADPPGKTYGEPPADSHQNPPDSPQTPAT